MFINRSTVDFKTCLGCLYFHGLIFKKYSLNLSDVLTKLVRFFTSFENYPLSIGYVYVRLRNRKGVYISTKE